MGYEFRSSLTRWFWFVTSQKDTISMLPRMEVTWRLLLGLNTLFQGWCSMWLAKQCWLAAEGLPALPQESVWPAWTSSQHGSQLLPCVFYDLATPITSTIFHWSQRNTLYMWGSNKRMNSQRQESLGTILEVGFDYLKISFQMKDNSQYSFRTVYYSSISFKKNFLRHSAWLVRC